MKKSGLADSPFFKMQLAPTSPSNQVPQKTELTKAEILSNPDVVENTAPAKTEFRTSEVPKSESAEVRELGSSGVGKLRSYELRKFDELRRLDIRITGEQKRFLDDLEEDIRQAKPEGDLTNPDYQRITKNSIIRALIEIARQLEIKLNASTFQNENDLLQDLFEELNRKVPNFRSPKVRK